MVEPRCFRCKHAEHINSGGFLFSRCKIFGEIICGREWITSETCKRCVCATCKYFEEENKSEK